MLLAKPFNPIAWNTGFWFNSLTPFFSDTMMFTFVSFPQLLGSAQIQILSWESLYLLQTEVGPGSRPGSVPQVLQNSAHNHLPLPLHILPSSEKVISISAQVKKCDMGKVCACDNVDRKLYCTFSWQKSLNVGSYLFTLGFYS